MSTVFPLTPFGYTTTVPGTAAPRFPSYQTTKLTTAPDMLTGGAVDLVFTLQLHLESSSAAFTLSLSNNSKISATAEYALSGSIRCGEAERKLTDNLRVTTAVEAWATSGSHGKTVKTNISNADGTELDMFSAWAVGFIMESLAAIS